MIGIGSNYGDRRAAVERAITWLAGHIKDMRASSVYETSPVGHSGNNYINAVALGYVDCSADEFESMCKSYELRHGRGPEERKLKIVPIDIDVVAYDGEILRPFDFKANFFLPGYEELTCAK